MYAYITCQPDIGYSVTTLKKLPSRYKRKSRVANEGLANTKRVLLETETRPARVARTDSRSQGRALRLSPAFSLATRCDRPASLASRPGSPSGDRFSEARQREHPSPTMIQSGKKTKICRMTRRMQKQLSAVLASTKLDKIIIVTDTVVLYTAHACYKI